MDFAGGGCAYYKGTSRITSEDTKKTHENLGAGRPISLPTFELGTCRTQDQNLYHYVEQLCRYIHQQRRIETETKSVTRIEIENFNLLIQHQVLKAYRALFDPMTRLSSSPYLYHLQQVAEELRTGTSQEQV